MLLFILLFGILSSISECSDIDFEILKDVHRILQKRDIASNIALDDSSSKCRNGGILAGNMCHCIHPHIGPTCQHFACVHGTSVGPRYDPKSLIFGVPCICDSDWKGELCDFKPDDQCGNKGEWKNDHCDCIGYYFGSECQYTSRCIEGKIKHGRCICNDGFDGDYCDQISCKYGTSNATDRSLSCVCTTKKYKGRHCDECTNTGIGWQPYPICNKNFKMIQNMQHAQKIREERRQMKRKQIVIISMCIFALVSAGFMIGCVHLLHRKAIKAEDDRGQQMKEERHILLTNQVRLQKLEEEVARESKESLAADNLERKKRRKSEPAINHSELSLIITPRIKTSVAIPK
ncbi:unnamed protein product [Caenorhabditis angaria]|uniref:EGF-like domain-containing protein n=1 Tax=Caenorhabditis angaria TaxID=860376 RepID=A0A9P1IX26_9PELO|nr:unnamed protein product [Caenorhabditis angaria]